MRRQPTAAAGYESDFALWAEGQITALRERRWTDLDIENLTEEIDGLTRRDRREIKSRFTVLMLHLLKMQYQAERASSSWHATIVAQAREIQAVLEDSPSLRADVTGFMVEAYGDARKDASRETGLPIVTFPQTPTPDFKRALDAALAGENFAF